MRVPSHTKQRQTRTFGSWHRGEMRRKGPVCASRKRSLGRNQPGTFDLDFSLEPVLLFAASQGETLCRQPCPYPFHCVLSTWVPVHHRSSCTTEAHQDCWAKSCLELDYKDLNVIKKCSKGTFLPLVEDIFKLGVLRIYVCDCFVCVCLWDCMCTQVGYPPSRFSRFLGGRVKI